MNNYDVGQYANKTYNNGNKSMVAQYNPKVIEEVASQKESAGVDDLSTVIPQVRLFIALITI